MHRTARVHSSAETHLHHLKQSLKLEAWPVTMAIVFGCSKLRLASFHLGHTPYGDSKVPCTFLSLDTLWRSHFRPYRRTHDQGGCVILLSDG